MNFDNERQSERSNVFQLSSANGGAIDPKTLLMDKAESAPLPDYPTVSAESVIQAANEVVPLITPSNSDFVAHIFRDLAEGASPAVCSKRGNPENGGWESEAAADVDQQCPPSRNNYINCSSFLPGADGETRARKEQASAFHFLMLDDVGTKVERSRLGDCVPSWEIETSPGNYQLGFCLEEPISDQAVVKALQDAAIRAGLCDPGAGGAVRWARLPQAINGKDKYADQEGRPFSCRLAEWNPKARYELSDLAKALGLNLFPVSPVSTVATPEIHSAPPRPRQGDDVYTPKPAENPVLKALAERGWYKRALGQGRHDVTCPWVSEHTDARDSGAAYFEPSSQYPKGGFRCQHSHGDQYHIGNLLEALTVEPGAARCTSRIRIAAGEIPRIKDAAELELASLGRFYQAGGVIVAVRSDGRSGGISTALVTEQELTSALAEVTDWEKFDGRSQKWVRTDPPVRIVQLLHRAQTYTHLPQLNGLARQPFVREVDGALVTSPGYDPVSGIYAAFNAEDFRLPELSKESAQVALAKLKGLLSEFHFASEVDRATSLSAMLTGAVRPGLPVAPGFNITASTPGSGKSYLADTIAAFTGPGTHQKISYPTSADEATKTVLSALLATPPAIVFDDMQDDWKPHGAMNRMFTSPEITDRILGISKTATVSTRSLIIGTGNNIEPLRDMRRRVATIRLSPRAEVPATLSYSERPLDMVVARRAEYVTAALTIMRAWEVAGRPRGNVPNIGSFERWSDFCRHSLIWLGEADPAESIIAQLRDNPDSEALGNFMKAWRDCFGDQGVTVRKALDRAENHSSFKDAIEELPVTERGFINRNKFGWYLKKNVGRIVGGFEIQPADCAERKAWQVVKVKGEKVGVSAAPPLSPPLAA